MINISIRFPEKKDAERLNNSICSLLQGWDKFIDNDIIISPVHTGWYKNKLNFFFDISIEANIDRTIELEGGTIGMQVNDNPIWAIVKEYRSDNNSTTEDSKN